MLLRKEGVIQSAANRTKLLDCSTKPNLQAPVNQPELIFQKNQTYGVADLEIELAKLKPLHNTVM